MLRRNVLFIFGYCRLYLLVGAALCNPMPFVVNTADDEVMVAGRTHRRMFAENEYL